MMRRKSSGEEEKRLLRERERERENMCVKQRKK